MPLPGKHFFGPLDDKPLNIKQFKKKYICYFRWNCKGSPLLYYICFSPPTALDTHLFLSAPKMSMIDVNVMIYKMEPPTSLFCFQTEKVVWPALTSKTKTRVGSARWKMGMQVSLAKLSWNFLNRIQDIYPFCCHNRFFFLIVFFFQDWCGNAQLCG